jgi:hypothetical protein
MPRRNPPPDPEQREAYATGAAEGNRHDLIMLTELDGARGAAIAIGLFDDNTVPVGTRWHAAGILGAVTAAGNGNYVEQLNAHIDDTDPQAGEGSRVTRTGGPARCRGAATRYCRWRGRRGSYQCLGDLDFGPLRLRPACTAKPIWRHSLVSTFTYRRLLGSPATGQYSSQIPPAHDAAVDRVH